MVKWFVGFTDWEGNFFISLDPKNYYARFIFKFALRNIVDLGVIEEIQSKLKIGYVRLEKDNKSAEDVSHLLE